MRPKFVHFPIQGYLDHWLVAGPQMFFLENEPQFNESSREQVARRYEDPELRMDELPVERGPLETGVFKIDDFSGSWEYLACGEDHRAAQAVYVPACAYLRSWAYVEINSKVEQAASLEVTAPGPLRLWLNNECVYTHQKFGSTEAQRFRVPVQLRAGMNPLFVRFENFGQGHVVQFFSARLSQPDSAEPLSQVEACIPTLIKSIGRRNRLEKMFQSVYMDSDVYAWDQQIRLIWPAEKASAGQGERSATIRLQSPSGRIYAEAVVDGTPGDQLILGVAGQYPEGQYEVLMMPKTWEFYEQGLRISHKISLWNAGRKQFSTAPKGTPEKRRDETLVYAATHQQERVEREMARMALAQWDQVEVKTLHAAADRAVRGHETGLLDLLSLLGLLEKFGEHERFPAEVKAVVESAALGYRFEHAPDCGTDESTQSESRPLLSAVCQVLAGQRYPEQVFATSGQKGSELRQQGEALALDWMRQRAAWGFAEWGAEQATLEILAGLAYLLDHAETESVWELSSALMDKIFFSIALNSFQGIYGSASSHALAQSVKHGGLTSAFSAVTYLMWGQGMLAPHLLGLVPLALSQNYQLPEIFATIAAQPPEEAWSKERHTTGEGVEGANLAAYKTPDYLLASAQSYRPGEPGRGEHIWQATLGPGAVVFTNHPGSSGESEAHLPGYWRGNGTLPRAAQWKDALLSIYHLPETAALPFTHAYFPTHAFDEYAFQEGWAFARKGSAYLALTSAAPFTLRQSGPNALRELVAPGRQNAWFCQLGRAARDGNFHAFQKKVLALAFSFQEDQVRCTTLAGDGLTFGWQGPFFVNESEQVLSGFRHFENPYTTVAFPSRSMEIIVGVDGLRLNLE